MLQPFAEMAGLELGKTGDIVATGFTSLPEAFKTHPYSSLNKAEIAQRDKFYARLAKLTGKSTDYLWNHMNYAVPSVQWVAALMGALQPDLDIYQAGAIANYAGGAVRYDGTFGISDVAAGSNDFLDVNNLLSVGTDQTVRLSDALLLLRGVNPGAHEYAVHLIGAKAKRSQQQADVQLAQDTKKVIKKELELAKQAVEIPLNIAEGALDTASAVGTAAKYWPWILGGSLVLVAYLAYRNRSVIASAATKYYTKGLV